MIALKEPLAPSIRGGMYIVAGANGSTRALVDPGIAKSLSRLRPAVDCIAHVLQRCMNDESLVVRITIERGPSPRNAKTCA
ncbi:MAG: hypothetical protein ISS72_09255 [Candidatus Brocadiae bacterium]|nr:hypothetical protein [Candidatus Brocadiia bacterium]